MSWANILASGRGTLKFRQSFDGFPVDFVTDASMFSTADANGRVRAVGLLGQSIGPLTEILDIPNAKIVSAPFTLAINSTPQSVNGVTNVDYILYALTRRPTQQTWLAGTCTDSDVTIAVLTTTGWPSAGVFYLDQEAVKYTGITGTTFTGCTRGWFNSLATYHYIEDGAALRAPEVTDWPSGIEAKRARTYAYGQGDDPQGAGTQIWLGIASTDARQASSAVWQITIDPPTKLFDQSIGADLGGQVSTRGCYYPQGSPFAMQWQQSTTTNVSGCSGTTLFSIRLSGFWETNADFCAALQAKIDALGSFGLFAVPAGDAGWHLELRMPSVSPKYVLVDGVSRVDWRHSNFGSIGMVDTATGLPVTGSDTVVVASTNYTIQWMDRATRPVSLGGPMSIGPGSTRAGAGTWKTTSGSGSPGSIPRGSFSMGAGYDSITLYDPAGTTFPDYRMYFGGSAAEVIPAVGGFMQIQMLDAAGTPYPYLFPIAAVSATLRYAEASRSSPSGGAVVWTGTDGAQARLAHVYADPVSGVMGTSIDGLRADLVGAAPTGAAVGSSPNLRSDDFDTSGIWQTTVATCAGGLSTALSRLYAFMGASVLGDVFAEEAKTIGAYFGLNASGQIALRPVGIPSGVAVLSINAVNELSFVQRSTWERNAKGTLNRVQFKTAYNFLTDAFDGPTFVARDVNACGRNPTAPALVCAPKSVPLYGVVFGGEAGGITPTDILAYNMLAGRIIGLFGYDYELIEVPVPLTAFATTTGTMAAVTSVTLPDSTKGVLGMASRIGQVIGKQWYPAKGYGVLTVMASALNVAGWSPTSRIASKTGTNPYVLTLQDPAPYGFALSSSWNIGDLIAVRKRNTTSTGAWQTGTITAITPPHTITVSLGGTFTIAGGEAWDLCYNGAAVGSIASTSPQAIYVWLADATAKINYSDGAFPARVTAP